MMETTAPRIHRASMRARPWFGFARGLLFALLPGLRYTAPAWTPPWAAVARQRRRVLLAGVAGVATLSVLLTPDGTPWPWTAMQALLLAWVAAGFATALMGAWVLVRGDQQALRLADPQAPVDAGARTAVIMPVCNEDITVVFSGLRSTCESLAATGALRLFDFYVLSDTSKPELRAAELRAWQRLRDILGDSPIGAGARIFYRWRRVRRKRKAGNVADFCKRWGKDYRYMVVLDADSTMHGDTLLSLVRLMEQNPRAGIVQTLPRASSQPTLHARVQQFASGVTGRLFALGMSWWQLGESHYWGHNAILRVEPFMKHCALAPLPGRGGLSGEILSHDFVEAAMMRRAGYEVWLAPELAGSWEQLPPNLLAELQRDRRWCQGNLQNFRLIAEPGWQPVHRTMFFVGAFSYAVAPLWLAFVALGVASGAGGSPALWALTLALLLLPRALGVASIIAAGEQKNFGGTGRLLAGAAAEAVLSAVQAPLRMLAHTIFVVSALTGLKLEWKSPPRDAAAVQWSDAVKGIGVPATAALAALVLSLHDWAAPHWAPLWLPLLVAVPFTVMTGSEALGRRLYRARLLATPEETAPPRPLARSAETMSFADLAPPTPALQPALAAWRPRLAMLGATAACCLAALAIPRPGMTPELPLELRVQTQRLFDIPTFQIAEASVRPAAVRAEPWRPAQRIDDDVRRRAVAAVERAEGEAAYELLINHLSAGATATSAP